MKRAKELLGTKGGCCQCLLVWCPLLEGRSKFSQVLVVAIVFFVKILKKVKCNAEIFKWSSKILPFLLITLPVLSSIVISKGTSWAAGRL